MRVTTYQVMSNDGCPQSIEFKTLKEARQEMRRIIKEDKEEFGLEAGMIDYYIEKKVETEDTIYYEVIR